jgi:hypothetical protein
MFHFWITDIVVAAYEFLRQAGMAATAGTFQSPHGYSCSPVIYKDKVIINGDSQEGSFVAALTGLPGKSYGKYLIQILLTVSAPLLSENIAGKIQMIFCGNREIASYNPDDGTKYWFAGGPSEDFCSSPVYNEKSACPCQQRLACPYSCRCKT